MKDKGEKKERQKEEKSGKKSCHFINFEFD